MPRLYREMPIKQKLMVMIMAATTVALLLSGIGIIVFDLALFRNKLVQDLSALSQIIADNSIAALAFEDPKAASETLGALRARPHLMTACIYRPDGTTLATYARPGVQLPCPPSSEKDQARFRDGDVTVSRQIFLQERPIGTLVLLYDLEEIGERMYMYGFTVLGVLLVSSMVAFLLSSRLRAAIASPLSQLAHAATSVSATRDFSIRAEKRSDDELGVVVDAFNEMLEAIQTRDRELTEALERLRRLNLDMVRSNEELARSNEDLERFAFVASHDLQEPLRMISVYSQLLVRKTSAGADSDVTQYVDQVVDGAQRMRALLSDLLAYAEIGARKHDPFPDVDLNAVLRKVIANLQAAIDETQAVITVDPMPVLRVFEGHFIALFQNLIGNAIKYRSAEPPRIQISVHQNESNFEFAVADNGQGIEPEYHKKIFAAFIRLHGRTIPGTGIGLAICQRVVQRYGGRIWVESERGSGATFRFVLPVAWSAKGE